MRWHKLYIFILLIIVLAGCSNKNKQPAISAEERKKAEREVSKIKSIDNLLIALDTINSDLKRVILNREIGKHYRDHSDFKSAIHYHNDALQIATAINDTVELIRAYNNLGTDFRRVGAFKDAMSYHHKALEMSEVFSDSTSYDALKNRTVSYNGIGNISLVLGYYGDSKRLFTHALEIEKRLESNIGQAINYANIGSVYERQDIHDTAMYYYNKSMEQNRLANSDIGISLCYSYFGNIYEKENRLDSATNNYEQSFLYAKRLKDPWHQLVAYISMGRVSLKQKKSAEAYKYINSALEIADKINASENKIEIYKLLYAYYKQIGNTPKALKYYEQSLELTNSMIGEQNKDLFMETRINFEQRRSKLREVKLMAEKSRQEQRTYYVTVIAIIVILSMLIIIGFTLYLKQLQQKRSKELEESNKLKNKFFSIISHDLKAPAIAQKMAIDAMSKKVAEFADEEIEVGCHALQESANEQVALIETITNWARVQTDSAKYSPLHFDIIPLIDKAVKLYSLAALNKSINIRHESLPKFCIVYADQQMIGIVLQNLINNAIKFTRVSEDIKISCVKEGELVTISVCDNGIGMTEEQIQNFYSKNLSVEVRSGTRGEKGTGLGLVLCRDLLAKNDSSLAIKSIKDEGTTVSFSLKTQM